MAAMSAFAQEVPVPATVGITPAATEAAAPADAPTEVRAIDEVIVTAQRRAENLQRVPVAVTAVDAEGLAEAQVFNIADIQAIAPSISFDVTNSAANSANIRIRGIGTVGNSRAFEGAVGVFIDGVYRTRAGQALQNWLDIEGIQILRGPQGTLFGKNTSAGALLINSTRPDLSAVEGSYEFTAGNYDFALARGAINTPINDKLALRVSGLWATQDGYIDNPNGGSYNDRDPRALKAQLLFEPTDALSLRLILDWSEERTNCCYGQVAVADGPLQPLINSFIAARGLRQPSSNFDDYEQVLSNDTDQTVKDRGAVLHADYEIANGDSLHSVTAYRTWQIRQWGMDGDFSGANILLINEQFTTDFFSQEFTYNGKLGDLGFAQSAEYVLGAYYSHEEIDTVHQLGWGNQAQTFFDVLLNAQVGAPPGTAAAPEGIWSDAVLPAKGTSYAAFAHGTFDLTDKLKMIAGLRYSIDEKEGAYLRRYFTPLPNAAFTVLRVQPGPEFDTDFDDQALTGTFGFQYQFSDSAMGYATYARGYKSGGVNIDNTAAGTVANNPALTPGGVPLDPTYKSEFIDGYELGLKTDYLGGRARSNLAAFYDDMKDLQVAQFSGTAFSVVNAPEATVYGLEAENSFVLTDSLTLAVDVTWLAEAEFGVSPSILNLSGREFAKAPELTGTVSLKLDQPISNHYALTGRAAAMHAGEQYTNTSNDYREDGQTEYALSLGLKSMLQGWSLTAWCQNCTDQRYVTQHFNSPLQGTDVHGFVAAPRTYGITFSGQF